jgi:hypothetical protein
LRRPLALLLLTALLAGSAALRGEDKPPEEPRLRKALERSLLFPGLGQLYEKQYAKAALFAALEVVCLAMVVVHARAGNDAYRRYRDAVAADAAAAWRLETERLDRRRNTAILGAAGVWVLNMADIFVFTRKKYGAERSLAVHPFYHHETHAYGAGITCRF